MAEFIWIKHLISYWTDSWVAWFLVLGIVFHSPQDEIELFKIGTSKVRKNVYYEKSF